MSNCVYDSCSDLSLPDAANMFELLVNNRIINFDLPIIKVFDKVCVVRVHVDILVVKLGLFQVWKPALRERGAAAMVVASDMEAGGGLHYDSGVFAL